VHGGNLPGVSAWVKAHGAADRAAHVNFGDCFAYALARSLDVALLFKGEDFPLTDITGALPSP
jgi:ribonuclease VapC